MNLSKSIVYRKYYKMDLHKSTTIKKVRNRSENEASYNENDKDNSEPTAETDFQINENNPK